MMVSRPGRVGATYQHVWVAPTTYYVQRAGVPTDVSIQHPMKANS